MNGTFKVMGVVQNGKFRLSVPSGRAELSVRLTSNSPQAGMTPETGEIDLSPYEGMALMVVGEDQGAWIYSAEIIDTAGPILSAVVERLSGQRPA